MLEVVIIDDEKIEAEGNKRRVLHMNHPEIESVKILSQGFFQRSVGLPGTNESSDTCNYRY